MNNFDEVKHNAMPEQPEDQFELYDLKIFVEEIKGHCTCSMNVGDSFWLRGGKISIPDNEDFCIFALQSTLPLLPAKQRLNHPADWMETDARVVCPDPACKLVMRIDRKQKRKIKHDDVSPISWESIKSKPS